MAQINIVLVNDVLSDVVDGLQAIGVLDAQGNFSDPTPAQDVLIAQLAFNVAETHGIDVPAKIEKLVKALPLLLELVN